jgi:hypothetical protein
MLPVSAQELAQIQDDCAEVACDKPAVIKRKTTTKDAYGSETEAFNPISPSDLMAGMTEPTGGQLQNYAYIIGDLAAWRLKFPVGTDVKLQDHVIIEGNTMVVQVNLTPRSYPALTTVLATEIKQQ